MSVNKAIILGNLGQDPELRYTSGGTAVANFSVATTDRRKDKDGNVQEETEWHKVTTWAKVAENCAKYLKKGSKVYIEGKLQTRKYEKDGVDRYSTEITAFVVDFLDPKGSAQDTNTGQGAPTTNPGDDEIPF